MAKRTEPPDHSDHLAFLRRWRRALRLPLNAAESRIVEGAAADPGVLRHLLAKVDRAAVEAALQRQPLVDDPVQRATFLAGAAALTGDPGVLLDALEARREIAPRADVARAFAAAIRDLDLGRLSHARLGRLLQLVDEAFAPRERLQTAFALLRSDTFRTALYAAARKLPDPVAATWLPLAAVHDRVHGGDPSPDLLEQGLRLLLDAPPEVLDAQPARIRFGLVDAALHLDAAWPLRSASVARIVDGLDKADPAWAGLSFTRAAGRARLGELDAATAILDEVLAAHPDDLRATVLLGHLSAPRLGPIALPDPRPGALRPGYALTLLRPVHVRTDADASAVALHRELALPGIAPPLLSDTRTAAPWFAVDGALAVLSPPIAAGLSRDEAIQVAADGARIAALLALAGVTLPDLDPGRFLVDGSPNRRWLLLADLTGARRDPEVAGAHMRTVCARFVRAALSRRPFEDGPVRGDLRRSVAARIEALPDRPMHPGELAGWLEAV